MTGSWKKWGRSWNLPERNKDANTPIRLDGGVLLDKIE